MAKTIGAAAADAGARFVHGHVVVADPDGLVACHDAGGVRRDGLGQDLVHAERISHERGRAGLESLAPGQTCRRSGRISVVR
jgi:hypothetical protein